MTSDKEKLNSINQQRMTSSDDDTKNKKGVNFQQKIKEIKKPLTVLEDYSTIIKMKQQKFSIQFPPKTTIKIIR